MGKKKTAQSEATPVEQIDSQVTADNPPPEQQKESITYVVVRDGFRVSDREYETLDDPVAATEKEFWEKVSKNHSWGEKVEIVQYDVKKHRIW